MQSGYVFLARRVATDNNTAYFSRLSKIPTMVAINEARVYATRALRVSKSTPEILKEA
jgi:hypothetical protein